MIYAPDEDSQLLLECVRKLSGNSALELGVGSCIITQTLEERFSVVAGSDIDFESIKFCKEHGSDAHLACCDAASAFRGEFELIVTNPPYLPAMIENNSTSLETLDCSSATPSINWKSERDRAVDGGQTGVEISIHFIKSALPLLRKDGKILMVVSSQSDLTKLSSELCRLGLNSTTAGEKQVFFEKLSVLEITFSQNEGATTKESMEKGGE